MIIKSTPIRVVLILSTLLFFWSCKSTRNAGTGTSGKSWKHTLAQSKKEILDFETLAILGKAHVTIPKEGVKVSLNYRINMRRDSVIWIRITKLGLEAFRVLIDRDSIHVLDKVNNQYIVEPLDKSKEFTGLDADFSLLQDLLLGNLHLIPEKVEPVKKKGDPKIFAGADGGTDFRYSILSEIAKVSLIEAINEQRDQETTIHYDKFEERARTRVPMEMDISITRPRELDLTFSHRKLVVNPSRISFKFVVPARYGR